MYRLLSTVFGMIAGVFGIAVFASQFIVRARPLITSIGWTMLAIGSLFAVSVVFDRLDARSRRTPATRILPTRRGVWSFFFCLFAMGVIFILFGLPPYFATKLPAGDSWGVAAIRLAFLASTIVIGVVLYVEALSVSEWFFKDRVFDDLYHSFGRSLSWGERGSVINSDISAWGLLVILVAAIGVLLDGHQLLAPFADAAVESRRARKLQFVLAWILEHPHTVRLHAAAVVLICVTWLGAKAVIASRYDHPTEEDLS